MQTLGLDISTSKVGLVILDEFHTLIHAEAICIKKMKSFHDKATHVKNSLKRIRADYDISRISIEQNLQAFRPGFSSAKTLFTLARFNGVVTYLLQEEFGSEVSEINVNHARKLVGLKIDRKSKEPTKEQVLKWVSAKDLGGFSWPEKTISRGTRKGLVIPAEECYDIADAYVIAAASLYESRSAT